MSKNYLQNTAKFCKIASCFLAFGLIITNALAQNLDDEIEKEIQRLEKQKRLLELKRQNQQLQKEVEQNSQQKSKKRQNAPYYPPNNAPQNNAPQDNPQNATPYYPQSNSYQNQSYQNAYNNAYQKANEDKTSQGYIRLEGSYGIGLMASPILYASHTSVSSNFYQANIEFGKQINGVFRTYFGSSFMEYKYKKSSGDAAGKFDGQYITVHFGSDFVPKFGNSPVRGVLGAYLGFVYAEFQDELKVLSSSLQQATGLKQVNFTSKGFGTTIGARLGLAFDLGKHAQIELGSRIGYNLLFGSSVGYASTFPYALYVSGYGALSFLF